MRITEILTESQLEQLKEGPKLDALGRFVGGAVRGAAKGIGAIAGGVVGAGTALKKGYQSGKAVVGDDPDPNAGDPGYTPPSADDINAQGPKGSALAKPQTGDAGKALAKTDAVTDKQTTIKAGETVYAQVKANINKLDKKGKQRILQLLTKSMATPDPAPAAEPTPAAPPTAAAEPAAGTTYDPAKAAADKAAKNQADTDQRNADIEKTKQANAAKSAEDAEIKAAAAAARAKPGFQQTLADKNAIKAAAERGIREAKEREAKKKKKIATAGKTNYGNALSEALAQRVAQHKQKMFETGLAQGTIGIFRK